MLVTGNGVLWSYEYDGGDDLFNLLMSWGSDDPLDDTIAEHALDTICFLQDEDIDTPHDQYVVLPWAQASANMDFDIWSLPKFWLFSE